MCKRCHELKIFNACRLPPILANAVDGGSNAQTRIQVLVRTYHDGAGPIEVAVRVVWNEAHVKSFLRIIRPGLIEDRHKTKRRLSHYQTRLRPR